MKMLKILIFIQKDEIVYIRVKTESIPNHNSNLYIETDVGSDVRVHFVSVFVSDQLEFFMNFS